MTHSFPTLPSSYLQRNHHAHLLTTTRGLGPEGLGEKTRELDHKQSGEVERWRERWAEMQNRALELANVPDRVDHRSHQRQGIEQEPTVQIGRAHVCTQDTNAQLVCRLPLEKQKQHSSE